MTLFDNPFRPGAGHIPPYLAGRELEKKEFLRLLKQTIILENIVLTGLRGAGKTVLLDSLKPIAMQNNWLWIGTDLSESASVSEATIATRLCTDLSIITSGIIIQTGKRLLPGFHSEQESIEHSLDFNALINLYKSTPGLALDKLKNTLEVAWQVISDAKNIKGVIFAYDESQNLSDQASKEQFPLSLLLDTFQSLQRKGLPLMLVLAGLPTLFPKLVESRTFSERMFHILFLQSLNQDESKEAILKPIEDANCPLTLDDKSVSTITEMSGGYPYFIQFICREVYDAFIQRIDNKQSATVPVAEIEHKLDTDFFAGRWAKATDRQRELLSVIAELENCGNEFTVQEITAKSKAILENSFNNSNVNQMLNALIAQGLVFRNRYGTYAFAVPLLNKFILRKKEGNGVG